MLGIECLLLIPFSIKWNQLDRSAKSIYYYLISSIIFAGGSILLSHFHHNNMWLFTIMHYLQFAILSLFYIQVIRQPAVKLGIKIAVGVVLFVVLADFFVLEGKGFFNSISATVRNTILITYGIVFFWQLLRDDDLIRRSIYINSLPSFWFNAGLFIYLCSSFLFGLSANFLHGTSPAEKELTLVVLAFNYVAGIIQIFLFYLGLQKIKKART
ncbi:hypothetical protein CK934_18545 [Chitinophaga sp. MD30]|nr:hypothetical protein CK934_18545 [Chitinophaga sp. MD30]